MCSAHTSMRSTRVDFLSPRWNLGCEVRPLARKFQLTKKSLASVGEVSQDRGEDKAEDDEGEGE